MRAEIVITARIVVDVADEAELSRLAWDARHNVEAAATGPSFDGRSYEQTTTHDARPAA